jgi:hypothetical protein
MPGDCSEINETSHLLRERPLLPVIHILAAPYGLRATVPTPDPTVDSWRSHFRVVGASYLVCMVHQLTAMIAELRKMDDIAGGGSVFTLAQQEFNWIAGLLDQATYDDRRDAHCSLCSLSLDSFVVGRGL